MKKILVIFSTLVLIFALALSGCSVNRKPAPNNQSPPARITPNTPNTQTPTPARDTTPASPAHTQASKLAQAAEDVDGVKAATVVITGSTVLVGLETEPDIEDNKTEEIKDKVTEKIKKADNSIKTVSITTDPNLITRLKKVAEGIKDGKPISSFTDELAEITRRIAPKTNTE